MIVLDTSFLFAALSTKDRHHEQARLLAVEIEQGVWGQPFIPDWVCLELAGLVERRSGRDNALRAIRKILDPAEARLVPCSPLLSAAIDLFTSTGGPALSLVDAGVVMAARRIGAVNVATYDQGFRSVAGLHVVDGPRTAG
jgi:predicted nucleic acid-binding protein